MRLFLKFNLIFTILLVISSGLVSNAYEIEFPRHPGPTLDKQLRKNYQEAIDNNQPQIVLIGDSTLVLGVDPALLSERTGKSVYSIGIPGSASAMWYLILKNNIVQSEHKPDYVLVVFRNTILTAPGYRVQGSYFEQLDEYARQNERVLIEKSFVNFMNPLAVQAERFFPLYVARTNIRNAIDGSIRYFAPPIFDCDRNCTDYGLGELFSGNDLEPGVLNNAIGAAESSLYMPENLDFDSQVERSFLPDMLEIADDNDLKLVFVRIKVASGYEGSPELDDYLDKLQNYIEERNAIMLDFGSDPRITDDSFRDSVHYNEEGQRIFSELVGDALTDIYDQK